MDVLRKKDTLCLACMEEHTVLRIKLLQKEEVEGVSVWYQPHYDYCTRTNEVMEDEDTYRENSRRLKEAIEKVKNNK